MLKSNYTDRFVIRQEWDDYDSTLARLNTIQKLSRFCDSLYEADTSNLSYPEVIAFVMRKKFYHEYSFYDFQTNPIGFLGSYILKNGAIAVVLPDYIVKYPYAACSQQSIVGMELFKRKGYPTRKVAMTDSLLSQGHFAYEAYYTGGWHYFDSDQEPDTAVLNKYKRPSVAYMASNPEIALLAYNKNKDPELFKRLILSYKNGPVNKFPAPNAYLYQTVTKFLSYFGWLVMLAIIIIRALITKSQKMHIKQQLPISK
ncbi:MAG: hypothetical protein ABUT20_34770 [Bacteroidota bacterium]